MYENRHITEPKWKSWIIQTTTPLFTPDQCRQIIESGRKQPPQKAQVGMNKPKGGLDNPLTMAEGTGVTVGNAGVFDGSTPTTFTIGIGQPVGLTDTVQFQNVTSSGTIHVGPNSFEIKQRDDGKAQVSTDWVVLGDIIAENYIDSSSIKSMSIAQASGSTVFGYTLNDSHQITGSTYITGSLFLNNEPLSSDISSYNEFN